MNIYRFRGNGRLVTGIYHSISIQIVECTSEMSSSHQNKNFDVLQPILIMVKNFSFWFLPDASVSDISAAILVNIAVIAEIPPSGLLILRVSLSQNNCQI